ncbi:hypothetical protein RB653_006073 [Dictyostelium firmibasis]|uniref:Uncharacterized protein n=1 Tax=Dictyostelium firmibasis TaxID=79012 RepID=A0AAN7U962_9MYCE
MKLVLSLILVISTIFVVLQFSNVVNGLSLKRREVGSDDWINVADSMDGLTLTYKTIANKLDFLQFRVDRDDESRILNDMYINVTSIKAARFGIFFNNFIPANSTTDNRGRAGYCPIWFASCGAETPYFSLYSNNSYTSDLTFTVTVRDEIKLCDF